MKTLLLCGGIAMLWANSLRAEENPAHFSTPPFTLNATVLGVDGWASRQPPEKTDPLATRVVAVRWDDYHPALRLHSANLKKTLAKPTTAANVTVHFALALTFPEGGRRARQVRLGFADAPFGEIFFDTGTEGGLGYGGAGSGGIDTSGTIVLSAPDIALNSYYQGTIAIDFAAKQYDIAFTGKRRDGTPFAYEKKGIAFDPRHCSLKSLYLISGSRLIGYLKYLEIKE